MNAPIIPLSSVAAATAASRARLNPSGIPDRLKAIKGWLCWRITEVKADGKFDKVPYYPETDRNRQGAQGSAKDKEKLGTFDQAVDRFRKDSTIAGIGLAMLGEFGIVAFDGDGCFNGENITSEPIAALLACTYCEVSPSGRGVRGFFTGTTTNRRGNGVEVYSTAQFVTVTGAALVPSFVGIAELAGVESQLAALLPPKGGNSCQQPVPQGEHVARIDLLALGALLNRIDPAKLNETEWTGVTMSVHHEFAGTPEEEGAIAALEYWSRKDAARYHEGEIRKDWRRFTRKDNSKTIEHLRELAGLPRADVQNWFGPVQAQQEQDPIWPGGWEWETPVDILDDALIVPPYDMTAGHLAKSYEKMMEANYRYHLHASREAYAGFFTSAVDMHLRPSVTVEERPGAAANGGTMYALVDQVGLVGASTKGKTATLMHAVGHERSGSLLNAWNGREQAVALKKMDAAIADIRAKHPGDDKVAAEKIKALKAATPIPDIVNSKITDKSLIATIASNVTHDLPTDLVIDEWENVYGGAAYRRDGGNSISDIHRKMFDGEAYSDKAQGTGKISAEMTLGNLAFACTPEDMARWNGYEAAMTNGDMARKSLYAPGAPFDGQRDQSINFGAIAEWRRIQRVLETLHDVKMTLESDPDFDRRVDKAVEEFGRQADGGDHVARWLAKSRIRMARMAARLWLVEQIEAGNVPSGMVTIPKAYRRRAWKYLTEFAWPHQVHVHNRLIAGESFKSALQILLRRIYANKLTTIKKDDLVGGRASVSMKRAGEDFVKVLLNTYHWIRPKATRKMTGVNLNRPWEAHQFEVNPMLCTVYRKYDDELLRQHEVAKGQIRDIFDREDF